MNNEKKRLLEEPDELFLYKQFIKTCSTASEVGFALRISHSDTTTIMTESCTTSVHEKIHKIIHTYLTKSETSSTWQSLLEILGKNSSFNRIVDEIKKHIAEEKSVESVPSDESICIYSMEPQSLDVYNILMDYASEYHAISVMFGFRFSKYTDVKLNCPVDKTHTFLKALIYEWLNGEIQPTWTLLREMLTEQKWNILVTKLDLFLENPRTVDTYERIRRSQM